MRVFAILTMALCFSMVLGSQDALLKAARQLTKRSLVPREQCDLSYLLNYPPDCEQAFKAVDASSGNFRVTPTLCEARCGQPAVNFYISCDLDFVVPTFIALCGTNAMGQRCGTETVQMALNTTTADIVTNCAGTIYFGTNCSTECQNTLTSARMSLGCCLNVLNTTAIVSNPVFNHQLWEQSCGVNVPSECISAIKPTITNGGAALVVTKPVLAVALLLLGTLKL